MISMPEDAATWDSNEGECELHFDDPTAHIVVEWFMERFRSDARASNGSVSTLLDSLLDRKSKPPDHLFKDLNVVRFMDCLRKHILESDYEIAEDIAKYLLEKNKWGDTPHFTLFLVLISSDYLMDNRHLVPESEVFNLGRTAFEYYSSAGHESDAVLAFDLADQLYFLDDNRDRAWEYLKFRYQHNHMKADSLCYLYSTYDPAKLYHRVKQRWSRNSAKELIESDYDAIGNLAPMLLDLPTPTDISICLNIVEEYMRVLLSDDRSNKKERITTINEKTAKRFRVLEWALLTRDVLAEEVTGELQFLPTKIVEEISGIPSEQFIYEFAERSAVAQYRFICTDISLPKERDNSQNMHRLLPHLKYLADAIPRNLNGFRKLLPVFLSYYPTAYKDIVYWFAELWGNLAQNEALKAINSLIIPDGELTFYSIIWLLRHSRSQVNCYKGRYFVLKPPKNKEDKEKPDKWLKSVDAIEFAKKLGLIIQVSDERDKKSNRIILTRRWHSLISWLQRQNGCDPQRITESRNDNEKLASVVISSELPARVSIEVTDDEKNFIENLARCFHALSNDKTCELLKERSFPDELEYGDFEELFSKLEEMLGPLIKVTSGSNTGFGDRSVFRICRAVFLPLEYLLRADHPHELHLLILALNNEPTRAMDGILAPISLGLATIAGNDPQTVQDFCRNSDESTAGMSQKYWISPYWTLLSSLASDISLPKAWETISRLGGITGQGDMLRHFSHEVGGLTGCLFSGSLVRITTAFEVDQITRDRMEGIWDEQAGRIILEDEKAREVAKWYVVQSPGMFRALRSLLGIWSGSRVWKWTNKLRDNTPLKQIVERLADSCRALIVAQKEMDTDYPLSFEDCLQQERMLIEEISKLPPVRITYDGEVMLWFGGEENNAVTSDFVRLFVFAMLNSLKWASEFNKAVEISVSCGNGRCSIEIKNETKVGYTYSREKARRKFKEGYGTKAILSIFLRRLSGSDLFFDLTDRTWVTRFSFPYQILYGEEKKIWLKKQ